VVPFDYRYVFFAQGFLLFSGKLGGSPGGSGLGGVGTGFLELQLVDFFDPNFFDSVRHVEVLHEPRFDFSGLCWEFFFDLILN
jgi:hypothetical protein